MGNHGKPDRIRHFDWVRAAEMIKLEQPESAEAFILNEDQTGSGVIFQDHAPVECECFATPPMTSPVLPPRRPMLRLRFNDRPAKEMACWTLRVAWKWDEYWPVEALAVLAGLDHASPTPPVWNPAVPDAVRKARVSAKPDTSRGTTSERLLLSTGANDIARHLPGQQVTAAHCRRLDWVRDPDAAERELFFELCKQRFMGRTEAIREVLDLLERYDAVSGEALTKEARRRNAWICRQLRLALSPLPDWSGSAPAAEEPRLKGRPGSPLDKTRPSNISGRWNPIKG